MAPLSWRVRGLVLAVAALPRTWAAFADQGLYLHKDAPLLFRLDAAATPVANYVIARNEFLRP